MKKRAHDATWNTAQVGLLITFCFFLERKVPLTLVYLGTTDWKLPHVPSSDEKESKRSFVRWRVHMCAFVVVQPLIYRAFLVSAWQLNTSPSAKQMAAVLGRGGGPGQNCRDGQTLTAALILLLFLLHTQGFLGFLKYFCLSVLSLLLPPPTLSLSVSAGCDWLLWQDRRWAVSLL